MSAAPSITHTIIPAGPGWSLAIFMEPDKEHAGAFYYETILAWEIVREDDGDGDVWRIPIPITIEGTIVDRPRPYKWAVKRPDGKFVCDREQTCDDEADAIGLFTKQVERERAEQKKTADAA